MSRSWTLTAILLGGLLGAGSLAAQDRTLGTDGTGTLHTGDDRARQEIRRIEATLYQNGGIDLKLMKGRDAWMFRGTWYGNPASGSVGFRLDSGFELPADGTGRLYLERGALSRVDFRGSNRDGAFELAFADREGAPSGGGQTMDLIRAGDGDLDLGDASDRLDRARVLLGDDGRAEVRVWGDTRYTLKGTWTGTLASGRIRLSITRLGRDEADISGSINTSRRSGWDRIALGGTVGNRDVRLRFEGEGDALEPDSRDEEKPEEPRRPIGTLDQTMRGAGDLTLEGGKGSDLRAVRVKLGKGGKAEIYLEGSGPRLKLRGKWSQRDNAPNIDLSITSGLGQDGTSGLGTLSIPDGKSWEKLNLSGRNSAGSWGVHFRANGPGHLTPDSTMDAPAPEPIREFSDTQRGEGSLTWPEGGAPTTVTQVKIRLGADKKATIDVEGSKPARFTGRWGTTKKPNQLELAINDGTMGALIAAGTVTLTDKGALSALTIENRVNRRPVKLTFKAQPAPAVVPAPR